MLMSNKPHEIFGFVCSNCCKNLSSWNVFGLNSKKVSNVKKNNNALGLFLIYPVIVQALYLLEMLFDDSEKYHVFRFHSKQEEKPQDVYFMIDLVTHGSVGDYIKRIINACTTIMNASFQRILRRPFWKK